MILVKKFAISAIGGWNSEFFINFSLFGHFGQFNDPLSIFHGQKSIQRAKLHGISVFSFNIILEFGNTGLKNVKKLVWNYLKFTFMPISITLANFMTPWLFILTNHHPACLMTWKKCLSFNIILEIQMLKYCNTDFDYWLKDWGK